ncbi:lipase family protein [Rhodococcus sp. NPDC058514]|uniref:lipase family protein n=1 Tax=unclassified Rhodococcus (in: high G+C Gram-positive bacteria) TaxID=192944 RepID=UPI00364679D8
MMNNMKAAALSAGVVAVLAGSLTGCGQSDEAAAESAPAAGALRSSAVLDQALSVPGAAVAYRMDYQTKGPGGVGAESTGALFVPEGDAPDGGWPVVAWAHGTVGVADDCAPSAVPRTERDANYLAGWLKQGYAVAASDYVGLGTAGVHPYLDGPTAGYNVVDSVRAARAVPGAPELSTTWMVVGQSQGAHSAMATAALATEYAPELDYRGAVATGLPTRSQDVLPIGPQTVYPPITSFIAMQLAGLRAASPELDLDKYLTPVGKQILSDIEASCAKAVNDRINPIPVGTMFTTPIDDPHVKDVYTALADVPSQGYDRPMFIAQGEQDRLVAAPTVRKHVELLRQNNVDFVYKEYPSDHSGTMAASFPDTSAFVREQMAAGN